MRQDQFERLQALGEKLMDRFLDEADPAEWPGAGLKIAAMDPQTRGDLYWTKKNGAATGMLYMRVEAMIGHTQAAGSGTTPAVDGADAAAGEKQLDAEIASAEREAEKLMRDLTSKKAFDKRVHGKA